MKLPIRSIIQAKKDHLLLSVDLSQAEAWIVAYAANEPTMKVALKTGVLHETTAWSVLEIPSGTKLKEEERYVGKKCNHAFNYKMGPDRCAEIINKEGLLTVSVKQTKGYHKKYLSLYNLPPWWNEIEEKVKFQRYLYNYYGFRRNFHQAIGNDLFKEAVAFIPQSTIADHMYGAVQKELGIEGGLLQVYRKIIEPSKGELHLIQSAHDSCMIEYPEKMDVIELFGKVRECLERPMIINGEEFVVPCDGKWGKHWEVFDKLKVT